jgi:hypothetical protein
MPLTDSADPALLALLSLDVRSGTQARCWHDPNPSGVRPAEDGESYRIG